ncbi:MAG TPA: YidB family protein [Candidatus Paceibacterota bacterium]|nr:YidB family protein [Candidatus Paceibacterota bacterium]HRZ55818.1 YidB family protein [Candidatus Paceibacterota bacterium]
MGLLDSIVGSLTGSGEGQNQLLQLVTGLITQHGGIEGVVQKFAAHGMGAEAQQWVGTGPNPPITGDHVQKVFGDDTVQQAASQLGVPPTQAARGLAALLPTVIDKLTPNGQSVSGPDLQNNIGGLLKGGTGSLGLGDLAKLFGK